MAGFSNHLAQGVINHFFRNVSQSSPTGHYLALLTSAPADDSTSASTTVEVSAPWYSRQSVTFDAPADATDVVTANSNTITFNAVTGSAVTVTHWAIFDASTSGNLQTFTAFDSSKVLNVDDVFVVNIGSLTLALD